MKKIKLFLNSTIDFLWVLQAFLRGILGDNQYKPDEGIFFFPAEAHVTSKRTRMLAGWLGYRPPTKEELLKYYSEMYGDPKEMEKHLVEK